MSPTPLQKPSRPSVEAYTPGVGAKAQCAIIKDAEFIASGWWITNWICVHTDIKGQFHVGTRIRYNATVQL